MCDIDHGYDQTAGAGMDETALKDGLLNIYASNMGVEVDGLAGDTTDTAVSLANLLYKFVQSGKINAETGETTYVEKVSTYLDGEAEEPPSRE